MKRLYTLLLLISFLNVFSQISGCTDPFSDNYNPQATVNDGSCNYAFTLLAPASSVLLPGVINETSGLITYNGLLYTHNDSSDNNLYELNQTTGQIVNTIPLTGLANIDWEEIAQDENYVYVGDFGNNSNGNRTDLKIHRVSKQSLSSGNPVTDVINFTYSNQVSFTPSGGNNTDFDCEAMIVSDTGIYLFTKQWVSGNTGVYFLPKVPGSYSANLQNTYNVQGLITGATYLKDKKLVALSGYSSILQPFVYLLYDFTGEDFFSGNKRKVVLDIPMRQTEGIATTNGLEYYITNERLSQLNIQPRLYTFNFAAFLQPYLESFALPIKKNESKELMVYPNPAVDYINISLADVPEATAYFIYDSAGRTVLKGNTGNGTTQINITGLPTGIYYLKTDGNPHVFKLIKK